MVLSRDDATAVATGQEHDFEATLEHAEELNTMLKTLMFREHATLDITARGVRVIVDDQNALQAVAYLKSELFRNFVLRKESVSFRIPLGIFAECMNGMSGNPINPVGGQPQISFATSSQSVKMTYDGEGEPLTITVEDDGVIFKCAIRTQTPDTVLDFEFLPENICGRVIMRPECLRDVLNDLDATSTTIRVEINAAELVFATEGELGRVKTVIPSHSDLMEKFECRQPVSNTYRISLIKRVKAALALANKLSLRVDTRGVLSMQFMVENKDAQVVFIEVFVIPDADEFL